MVEPRYRNLFRAQSAARLCSLLEDQRFKSRLPQICGEYLSIMPSAYNYGIKYFSHDSAS